MTRYLRLYAQFVRFSVSRSLEFRLDFFFRFAMDLVWYATHVVFFGVLYGHTSELGGWTYDQALVFVATVFVVDAAQMTLFSNNMWWFPIFVNRGDLDYHLVRPVSSLFFVSLRDFAANSFLNLVVALGVLGWAIARYPEPFGPGRLAAYAAFVAAGVFLHYCLTMIFLVPVFWLHTARGLREFYWPLQRLSTRPHRIFTGFLRRFVLTLLPVALIMSYPTAMVLEGPTWADALHVGGVVAGAFLVLLTLWRLGLRAYASASS